MEVTGYPADEDKIGYLYSHQGPFDKIIEQDGGCRVFYDVDVTPGMSGAPLYLLDNSVLERPRKVRESYKVDYPKADKVCIGIHNGTDPQTK